MLNKFTVREIVTVVILSVLIVLLQLVVNGVAMVNTFFSLVLSSGIICFLSAPIYVLMIKKIKKPFVTSIYTGILALVYLIMGYWFISIYLVIIGFICEVILYKKQINKRIVMAWTFFSVSYIGTSMLPIFILWDDYVKASLQGGMSMEYINSYRNYYTDPKWIFFIVIFAMISGLIGSYYGLKLVDNHFDKAGIL